MNFVTLSFALFFAGVLLCWAFSRHVPFLRSYILLAANLFFYAYTGLAFVPLLIGIAALNWGMARCMRESSTPVFWLRTGVFCHLGILGLFKYYEFFVLQLISFAASLGIALPIEIMLPPALAGIALPVGISFYIFQGIAYLAEQYKQPGEQSYMRLLLYLSFFPTVLAGPIMRPAQFFPQLDAVVMPVAPDSGEAIAAQPPAERSPAFVTEGIAFILSGLFKKVVLASFLSEQVVRDAFQGPEAFSGIALLLAVYGYTIQIFCDFSGYTDLALGVGRLLGFSLPQNFAAPYLACNIQDFWRRWHISLSTWLRDYLYIPLGGSKKGNRYVNLCITMVLGGLWHGAHLRFIVWGALHGVALALVHLWHNYSTSRRQAAIHSMQSAQEQQARVWPVRWVGTFLAWAATFHFVAFAWIFFRAEDMPRAIEIIQRIACWEGGGAALSLAAVPAIACGLVLQYAGPYCFSAFVRIQTQLPLVAQALIAALAAGVILRMGPDGVLPFIYFQF